MLCKLLALHPQKQMWHWHWKLHRQQGAQNISSRSRRPGLTVQQPRLSGEVSAFAVQRQWCCSVLHRWNWWNIQTFYALREYRRKRIKSFCQAAHNAWSRLDVYKTHAEIWISRVLCVPELTKKRFQSKFQLQDKGKEENLSISSLLRDLFDSLSSRICAAFRGIAFGSSHIERSHCRGRGHSIKLD